MQKDPPIVIISTCNVTQEICTYYVPLEKETDFLAGHLDCDEYLQTLNDQAFWGIDWKTALSFKGIQRVVSKVFPSKSNNNEDSGNDHVEDSAKAKDDKNEF